MADARGLGPRGETLAGSSPVSPTILLIRARGGNFAHPCPLPIGWERENCRQTVSKASGPQRRLFRRRTKWIRKKRRLVAESPGASNSQDRNSSKSCIGWLRTNFSENKGAHASPACTQSFRNDQKTNSRYIRYEANACEVVPGIQFLSATLRADSSFSIPIFFKNGSRERLRPRNFSIEIFTSRESPGS
jgi:hypothetical protein